MRPMTEQAHNERLNRSNASYPLLIVRVMPAVYVTVPIVVELGEEATCFGLRSSFVRHPGPLYEEGGGLTRRLKEHVIGGVALASAARQRRMCVLWSISDATCVEPDGSIREGAGPPTGGLTFRGRAL
ncbi:hypothetical protein GCM10022280_18400 [Sphingomonas swuensis]|uniref:Uncharacterized protein n=1 Tax=Sphingomonas swuensis TaxID=977800 RepID=A0ABP7SZW6_9SPHN